MLPHLPFQPLHVNLIAVVAGWGGVDPLASEDQVVCDARLSESYLREISDKLVSESHVATAEISVRSGDPAITILDEALKLKPALILISTHGRSGFQRLRLGSVADQVIRLAPCPTLVVGPHVGNFRGWKSVLVPLDGSNLAQAALSQAAQLAREATSSITLVRVVPTPIAGTELVNARAANKWRAEAKDYLTRVRSSLRNLDVRTEVREGSPGEELPRFIKENDIGLVVMTAHGRTGLGRAVLGSVTDRVIANSETPVMVVPAPKV
jgi:nucleotide-binding universal stress UspA family protein